MCSSCPVSTLPALNDISVQPIYSIVTSMFHDHSQLDDWGSACPQLTVGCCIPQEQDWLLCVILAFEGNGRGSM